MDVTPDDLARALVEDARLRNAAASARAVRARSLLDAAVAKERAAGALGRVWLIGSLAWGDFHLASDLDLVVEGPSARWDDLAERLSQQLSLTVELLPFDSLPADFRERILREGVAL